MEKKFLSEQLESFLNQTRLPDELIICDDRSTDNTIAIINEYSKKAPFLIKLTVNENNLGSTRNFEKAISLCTGDIIFLSDQDDVWMPEKIELIENEFKKSPDVGLVFTDAELVDEKLNFLGRNLWSYFLNDTDKQKLKMGNGFEVLKSGGVVTGATMAFRSDMRDVCLPIPSVDNFIHDAWIAFMSLTFSEVIPLNIQLIKYRQHTNQLLGVKDADLESDHRPKGYSRYQAYQGAVERQTKSKNAIETLRKSCEISLRNHHFNNLKWKVVRDPVLFLSKTEESFSRTIRHYKIRRDMPARRIKRIPNIASELLNGNYRNFSRGIKSAVLDFFEKIKE